ncbi:FecR domain-containing protein, partial [Chloroflexota bacterium]
MNKNRKKTGISTTVLAIITLMAMVIAPLTGCGSGNTEEQITLSVLEGRADYQKQGKGDWSVAAETIAVNIDDHIRTRHISKAVLSLPDGSRILLDANTELTVEIFELIGSSRVARIRLIEGKVNADIAEGMAEGSLLEIVSEDSVVAVVGTKLKVENREGTDFSVDLLDGTAHVAHLTADEESGKAKMAFYNQTAGTKLILEKNAGELLSLEERKSALKVGEVIVSSGLEAINEVKSSGDINRGLEKAKEIAKSNSGIASAFRILNVNENQPQSKTEITASAFTADDFNQEAAAKGAITSNKGIQIVSSTFNSEEGVMLGETPDVDKLINNFEKSFMAPQPVNLFNEEGIKIGEQPPPAIVFDNNGEPMGKQPLPPIMIDNTGNGAAKPGMPEFVMIKDPFSDKLIAVSPEQLVMPTINKGINEAGLAGHQMASPVMFDEARNLQTTIITYDKRGMPIGVQPFNEEKFFDNSGKPVEQAYLPFVSFKNGRPTGQEKMSMVMFDEDRKPIEIEIPPTMIFDESGKQMAMQEMPTLLLNEHGQPLGIEAGGAITPEGDFFRPGESPTGGWQQGSSMPGGPPQIVYHSDGTPVTMEQFRPAVIMRNEGGEKVGYQPTPSTWFANPEAELNRGDRFKEQMTAEKEMYIVLFDSNGTPNVVQLNQEIYFNKDGNIIGEQPPPFIAMESNGKPTGLYESQANFWQPPPMDRLGSDGQPINGQPIDGWQQPPPGGFGPDGQPMDGQPKDGWQQPPPGGFGPDGQPINGQPQDGWQPSPQEPLTGSQIMYNRDGNPIGNYEIKSGEKPNFKMDNVAPVHMATYKYENGQFVAPTGTNVFEIRNAPPPGVSLGGMPGEWIPPADWKEPPPVVYGPNGERRDGQPMDGQPKDGWQQPPPVDGSLPYMPPPDDKTLPYDPPPVDGSLPYMPPPDDGSLPYEPPPDDGSLPYEPPPDDGSLPYEP